MFVVRLSVLVAVFVFFFKQKTAYEMRISDWSSDVCSSDLKALPIGAGGDQTPDQRGHRRGIDAERLGAAAHFHPRTLQVEVGIDPHRQARRHAQDRQSVV